MPDNTSEEEGQFYPFIGYGVEVILTSGYLLQHGREKRCLSKVLSTFHWKRILLWKTKNLLILIEIVFQQKMKVNYQQKLSYVRCKKLANIAGSYN